MSTISISLTEKQFNEPRGPSLPHGIEKPLRGFHESRQGFNPPKPIMAVVRD